MYLRKILRHISDKLHKDFLISAETNHAGIMGSQRENFLIDFLSNEKRLPSRYGLSSGEIISAFHENSRQCDIIVYDAVDGIFFNSGTNTSVFPVESVFGIIEVKSTLTKETLIEACNNIRSVKMLTSPYAVTTSLGGGLTLSTPRPRPFGFIFAYQLGNNSLDSLLKNLQEWENANDSSFWINYICILDEGCLFHSRYSSDGVIRKGDGRHCISSDVIDDQCSALAINYKNDSLIEFYKALLETLVKSKLSTPDLRDYANPARIVNGRVVRGHDRITIDSDQDGVYKLSDAFIDKVYNWCQAKGSISYSEYMEIAFEAIPENIDSELLGDHLYYYNPNEKEPISKIIENYRKSNNIEGIIMAPIIEVFIDNVKYVIRLDDLDLNLIEIIPDMKRSDL